MEKEYAYFERLESLVQSGFNGLHQELINTKDELISKIDALNERMLASAADAYFDSLEDEDDAQLNADRQTVDDIVHSTLDPVVK
jgi:hypothetical protein